MAEQKDRSLSIISHRGFSSLFPQNTIQSIEAGLLHSDFVEFDILLTKDEQVIVFHDRFLSEITDVADFPEFKDRKTIEEHQKLGTKREDWWVHNFTIDQLRKLSVKQKTQFRPQLQRLKFQISTLSEVIESALKVKERIKTNKAGFLIEPKSLYEFKDDPWDALLVKKTVEVLNSYQLNSGNSNKFPIQLFSFSKYILVELYRQQIVLPIYHLYDDIVTITEQLLKNDMLPISKGIGITENHCTKGLRELCDMHKLKIFYWTIKDDDQKIPFNLKNYHQVYTHLKKIGINGIITEFPMNCRLYLGE